MRTTNVLGASARAIGGGALGLMLVALWLAGSTRAGEPREFRSEQHAFRVVVRVEGLEHPWGLAFLPDGRLLVTERPGRLRMIADGRLDPQPIGGVPKVAAYGQGGLLDVVLHPRYAETGWVYLSYSGPGEGGAGTEVLRGRLRGGQLTGIEVIFRLQPKSGAGQQSIDGTKALLTEPPLSEPRPFPTMRDLVRRMGSPPPGYSADDGLVKGLQLRKGAADLRSDRR